MAINSFNKDMFVLVSQVEHRFDFTVADLDAELVNWLMVAVAAVPIPQTPPISPRRRLDNNRVISSTLF
jgi:hypothetical protein